MSTNRWVNPVNNNILRDDENNVLASGSVEFFEAGTSTPISVYSDAAQTSSLGSYLDADAFGLLPDFHLPAGTQVKAVAYDAIGGSAGAGSTMWTRDVVFSADSSTDTRLDALETSVGSIQAGYGNAVINGGMRVASTGGSVTLTTSYLEGGVAGVYGKVANVTAGTLVQVADTDYSTGYALHFSGVSTSDAAATVDGQFRINSKDSQRFVDSAAVFTCNVEHDKGSAVDYTITVSKADAQDDFSAITTIQASASATSVTSGTITSLTLAVTDMGDCSNGISIVVSAASGIVTTKNFKIGIAQFEAGSAATGFSEMPHDVIASAVIYDAFRAEYDSRVVGIATATVSGTPSSIDFASVFSDNTSYKYFRFLLEDVEVSSGGIGVRVSVDGSTFVSSASAYNWLRHYYSSNGTAATVTNSTGDTEIDILGAAATAITHGWVDVARPDVSSQPAISSHLIANRDSASFAATADAVGSYLTTDVLYGLQFVASTFTAGTVTVLASNRPF